MSAGLRDAWDAQVALSMAIGRRAIGRRTVR
jgi:hypothetical protein